eukprot:GFUD01055539.1.p1 GENE.GFUD01055539.1~~GFUD01055539.1.p1  ORF type:complete len:202 (+),score=20.06 GFUD01055539.1:35-640(+)
MVSMTSYSASSVISVFIIVLVPMVFCRSICVRPADSKSLYTMSPHGAAIAKLVNEVSSKVTSEFMIDILSSGKGHSALLCGQDEWDRMAKDYHHCVRQVQHQLKCGGQGGVCAWVRAFVDSCTGEVMGRCWTKEAKKSLQQRQLKSLSRSNLISSKNCENFSENNGLMLLVKHLNKDNFLSRKRSDVPYNSLLSSELLRLG